MRYSDFNVHSDPVDGKVLLYNTFNGKSIGVTIETLADLRNGLISEKCEERSSFIRNNFFAESAAQEWETFKDSLEKTRTTTRMVALTVLTNMDCNLRCVYCYQEGFKDRKYMDTSTLENVCKFLENQVSRCKPEILYVHLYGGEPLMHMDAVRQVATESGKIAERHNCKLILCMTTNGLLLSDCISNELKSLGIRLLQVTIDGTKDMHDQRRPTLGGQGTYSKIMANLQAAAANHKITLRINIDRQNKDDVFSFLRELKNQGLNRAFSVNPELVQASFSDLPHCDANVFQSDDERLILREVFLCMEENDIPVLGYLPIEGACEHYSRECLAVDPHGALYMCQGFAGIPEFQIGNVNETPTIDEKRLDRFMRTDPWRDCVGCAYAPLCRGGCRSFAQSQCKNINCRICRKDFFEAVTPTFLAVKYRQLSKKK